MQNIEAGIYCDRVTAFENPQSDFGLIPVPNAAGERLFVRDEEHLIARLNDHPQIHEWMHARYQEAGGEGDFNCETLVLDAEDVRSLNTTFPEHGDIWRHAHRMLQEGFIVYYESWF